MSETTEISGDARSFERYALEGSISPRFVVGGIDGEVVGSEKVVVVQIEDTIVAVEIARHENDFHVVVRAVFKAHALDEIDDAVFVEIMKVVTDDRGVERSVNGSRFFALELKAFLHVGARA